MIYENNKGQKYEILEEYYKKVGNGRVKMSRVRYLETGTIDEHNSELLKKGYYKDRYAKDILGVACMGNAVVKNYFIDNNRREYRTWHSMITRCYNPSSRSYLKYGGSGITVSDRWLCFEYFLEDMPKIQGYDKGMFRNGLINLYFNMALGSKQYSLDTCFFESPSTMRKLVSSKGIIREDIGKMKIIGISPKGEEVVIDDVYQFCKDNNLIPSHVDDCINRNRQRHRKWRFKKYDNNEQNS